MALVTTAGAANSDSYTSVVAADTYHGQRGNDTWAAASTEAKEEALRRATDWLDAAYYHRWTGTPANGRDQALSWPRSGATDYHGTSVDAATIPAEVVAATAEAALLELESPRTLFTASQQTSAGGVIREQVGPISRSYSPKGKPSPTLLSSVELQLRPLIGPNAYLPVILVV